MILISFDLISNKDNLLTWETMFYQISGKFGDEIAFEVNDQIDPELFQVGSADDEEEKMQEAVHVDDASSKQQ